MTPERWQRLVAALPVELLSRPPAPGQWSARDCLRHLVDAERTNFPVRFRAFMEGRDFAPFDPNRALADLDAQTPEQLAATFAGLRRESLALLEGVTDADLGRTVRHPAFGPVTLGQMLQTWAAHDLNHTVQAERALMQPFILACGPWHSFFTDHVAATPEGNGEAAAPAAGDRGAGSPE